MCSGQASGPLDGRSVGLRIGEGDVGADRVVEQQRVLEHDADGSPQVVQAEFAHIDAVDRDRAGVDVVEPDEESGDRRLP